MRNHNSQNIGFYSETLASIYLDMVSAILTQNEIDRDVATLQHRSSNEGMSFLTKRLPALGKSIDVSLANGTVLDCTYSGFSKIQDMELPSFMGTLFRTVFRADGVPRFATWYYDYRNWLTCQAVMSGVQTDITHDEQAPNHRFCAWLHTKIQAATNKGIVPPRESLQSGFPGNHYLREVLSDLPLLVWEAINVGLQDTEPLHSNMQLNSLREEMVVALRAMRQVCFCYYKLNIPFTDEQEAKTLADFVEVERTLDFNVKSLSSQAEIIRRQARRIVRRVLANADPRRGIPRHGPGAVATGEKSPEKHHFKRYYRRLAAVFSYDEWFFCNAHHVCDSLQELQAMEELEVGTAKVVLVPKDSRGPRLISCEPLEYQWIQQSLMRVLVDTIESHPLTKGYVNFTDQSVNRELALEGSDTSQWSTLDMKEASDRVSCNLVETLFPELWWDHLYASRTDSTLLPSGKVVQLRKFAPMGSAVCFPVEALIFWALSVSTLMIKHHLPLRKAATEVYVYGDDIICDAKYHGDIIDTLPEFGLMLNDGKCCIAGPFKESCGMDAFYGHSVTPTKIRSMWCNYPEPSMIASYVEYSNELYRRNQFESAYKLESAVQWVLRSNRLSAVPTVSGENPSCIAFVRQHERALPKNRSLGCKIRIARRDPLKPDYQVHEVQGYRLESKPQMAKTYGWPFLLRILTELEAKKQVCQTDRLAAGSLPTGQYPIAHRVRLKRAWTPLT